MQGKKPAKKQLCLRNGSLDWALIMYSGLLWRVPRSVKVIQPQFTTPKNAHMQWSHNQSLYNIQDFPFICSLPKYVRNVIDRKLSNSVKVIFPKLVALNFCTHCNSIWHLGYWPLKNWISGHYFQTHDSLSLVQTFLNKTRTTAYLLVFVGHPQQSMLQEKGVGFS